MAKRLFTQGFIVRDAEIEITRGNMMPVPALTRVQITEEFGDRVYGKFSLPKGRYINGHIDRSVIACDLADRDLEAVESAQESRKTL